MISIVGMPGIGKTTLAMKIFHDRRTQYKFDVRIWVYVSQHFTRNDIFLSILNEVTSLTEEEKQSKTDTELASAVADHLRRKCFLLVMDDVWSCKDWDTLQIELPWSSKMGSKVLITSREAEVGWHVNARAGPHMLRVLTTAESYRLLRREVFGKAGYRRELEDEGSLIAERCKGLPLAILHVAGILRESFLASSEMSATKEAWKEVSDILATYDYDHLTLLEQITLLSYKKNRFRQRPGDQSGALHRRTGEETANEGTASIDARFTQWDAR